MNLCLFYTCSVHQVYMDDPISILNSFNRLKSQWRDLTQLWKNARMLCAYCRRDKRKLDQAHGEEMFLAKPSGKQIKCFSDYSLLHIYLCNSNYEVVCSSGTASGNTQSPGTLIRDTKGGDSLNHHMSPLTQGTSQVYRKMLPHQSNNKWTFSIFTFHFNRMDMVRSP